jgi:hypothetical protein
MPWHVEKRGKEFCVIKDRGGKNEGCSKTRELAVSHMRALYGAHSGWEPTGKKKKS